MAPQVGLQLIGLTRSMTMTMTMTSYSDKDFAMMMKMHHQKGLEMAKKELAEGKSRQMKAMAQKIVDSQIQEFAEFDKWLAAHN
jgi:uncharacterized protein (DUF305 family)